MTTKRPRYGNQEFPPYSYVPGHAPHPISDPAGHSYGATHSTAEPLQPASWQDSSEYVFGVDLFNHGYYWEAHEAWEALWLAAGRQGGVAQFLKALIKLAAAGVKAREGNPRGVMRHCQRAIELLHDVHSEIVRSEIIPANEFCGVDLPELIEKAVAIAKTATRQFAEPQPHLLLDVWVAVA